MFAPARLWTPAFRRLESALTRRRLLQLDLRLRIELVLLALLIGAFLFWQVRVPLDGLARARGAAAAIGAVAWTGLALAALGGLLAGIRHARLLRSGVPGPEWLALPVEHAALERHLAWDSRGHALWVVVPALGVLAAAIGLVPIVWLASLAIGFVLVLRAAAALGCALAYRLALRMVEPRPGLHPIARVLAVHPGRSVRRRLSAAIWRRAPAWVALAAKDLLITLRRGSTRSSAVLPLALGVASILAWQIPGELALRHYFAFALTLLAAAALAEWLVVLAGSDPFAALRVLPIGVWTVWGARFLWAAAGTLLLIAGHALAARGLGPRSLQLFLAWSAAATLAIAALGVNYGVTLFPRADLAQRLLALSLGLAVASSVMLPLSGWIVLLAAVLHSARRLPRWARLEEA